MAVVTSLVTVVHASGAAGAGSPTVAGPLPVSTPSATPAGVTVAPPDVPSAPLGADGEVTTARTAQSRTFVRANGTRTTRLYAAPVNYQDGTGAWQKIDTTLVARAGATLTPAGVATPVSLPTALSAGPVTVTSGGGPVTFRLLGAGGAAAATSGSTATYADVLPGVTATETVTGQGVKEDLLLASSAAAHTFTFAVGVPAGDSLVATPGGGAAVTDPAGRQLGVLPAPTVRDASGSTSGTAATMTVAAGQVTVGVDPAWLTAPGRAWPVDLDPSYGTNSGLTNTQVEGGSQAGVQYGSPTANCVGNDPAHAGAPARSLVSFPDVGSMGPRDAQILSASLGYQVTSVGASTQVALYNLTRSFTSSQATWNSAATGSGWTTAGGDYAAAGTAPVTVNSVDTGTGTHGWALNPAWVQGWLDTPTAGQHGLLLKAVNETGTNQVCFAVNPGAANLFLSVTYQPRIGVSSSEKYFTHAIDGHEKLNVNLADGNLVDTATEYTGNAPGVPLSISRTYNSMQAQQPWMNGLGWWTTPSDSGVYCCNSASPNSTNGAYSVYDGTLLMSSGLDGSDTWDPYHPADYTNTNSGAFSDAPGTNATLATNPATGDSTLTHHGSQTVENVTAATNSQLATIVSRTGLTEQVNHNATMFGGTGDPDVTTVVDTVGRTYTYSYGTGGGYLTGITGPTVNGAPLTTGYTYQGGSTYNATAPNGELLTATDTGGGITSYGYDSSARINKITSPAGKVVTLTYDAANRVTSLTYVTNLSTLAGDTYLFAYTAAGSTGGNGTTVVQDPLYNAGVSTSAHTTTYHWNPDDQVVDATDGAGRHRATTFDPNGDGLSATDGLGTGLGTDGNTSTNTYDNTAHNGQTTWNPLTSQGAPLAGGPASMTTTDYPSIGAGSSPTAASYRPMDTYNSYNGSANKTSFAYDQGATGGPGLLTKTTLPASMGSTTTSYQGYNGVTCGAKSGQVCSSTDADTHTTTLGYDSAGNVTTVTPPAPLPATTSIPDALGRTVTSTDGNANTTRVVYNGLGQVTQTTIGGTTTCTTSDISAGNCDQATYDSDGRQLTLTDWTGTTTYSYDLTGAQTGSSEPGYYASTVGYDAAGRTTSFTDDGGTVTYTYDDGDALIGVAEPGGSCYNTGAGRPYSAFDSVPASSRCTAFHLDGNANTDYQRSAGGAENTYTRDNNGRLLSLTALRPDGSTVYFSQTLTYNVAGTSTDTAQVRSLADSDAGAHTYGYDMMGRLTSDTVAGATSTWTLDPAGNRTSYTPAGGSTLHSAYNPADQLCETGTTAITTTYTGACTTGTPSGSNTRYTYDGDGNQTTGLLPAGNTTLAYNNASQTTSSTTAGTSTSYAYNSTSQTYRQAAGGTGYASGLVAKNGQPSRITNGPTYEWVTRTPDGTPITLRKGSGGSSANWYYTLDDHGSARRLTTPGGSSSDATYSYDAYGQALVNTQTTDTSLNPVNYTGGTRDATTGLTKLGLRYYDTTEGRFTQKDPTGQDASAYAYANDDPINRSDPSGAFSFLGCGYHVARFILENGPIIGEFRDTIKALGGIRAIIRLIRAGKAFDSVSNDVRVLVDALIGSGAYHACT